MAALEQLAADVGQALQRQGWTLATAESCTGGWIAKLITDVAGSSAWFERGFVSYSNDAKIELLSVEPATLTAYGAVSAETVAAMAQGALQQSYANMAVAVSGIAGPGGGSTDKPVGTVWLGWATSRGQLLNRHFLFTGDRNHVRRQAVEQALQGILELLAANH